MSVNHHFSSDQIPQSHLYFPHYMMDSSSPNQKSPFMPRVVPCKPTNFFAAVGLKNEDEEESAADDGDSTESSLEMVPKDPLFEKPLTPSDVGKLNRLVIPKQHAEKYFPLSGGGDAGEKGFLLSFEDEAGKAWRFRYSYWNSSQSYVLTKGWSRFVKEKRLDAGDFVLFSRHRLDCSRLFIGWRRRHSSHDGGGGCGRGVYAPGFTHIHQNQNSLQGTSCYPYQPDCHHAGSVFQAQTGATSGNSKKLRLFGVNLECQAEPPAPADRSFSASQLNPYQLHPFYSTHQNQTDLKFSLQDDGYRRG